MLSISLSAEDVFTIPWSSISGGGSGRSPEPAEFTLTGSSIGQIASEENSGPPSEFGIAGGYWTFPFEPALPDLHLAIQLTGNTVTLTWDADGPPVTLESSSDLELWQPVVPQPTEPFFHEPSSARKYYRLSPAQ